MSDLEESAPKLQTWKVTLAYDGTDFSGWQVQPGEVTIQGELQAALGRITGEAPLPQGSGRTDAGVHALGQVASFPGGAYSGGESAAGAEPDAAWVDPDSGGEQDGGDIPCAALGAGKDVRIQGVPR